MISKILSLISFLPSLIQGIKKLGGLLRSIFEPSPSEKIDPALKQAQEKKDTSQLDSLFGSQDQKK